MQKQIRDRILKLTGAARLARVELIQPLWNSYGTLSRAHLVGGGDPSVIVKHIRVPKTSGERAHPRGFTGAISRARKIRSYEVETRWYQHYNQRVPSSAPTPRCLGAISDGAEQFIVLEDLATRGFTATLSSTSLSELTVLTRWLAHFHAQFIEASYEGLWPCGTYWHLATRPEELAKIEGTRLHRFASLLDARLRCGRYPTLVHGDAKLANFLFSEDHAAAAAVDFQYVGRGSAMQDLAYLVGSCLSGVECERHEAALLGDYFEALRERLPAELNAAALEEEWRSLYPVAWADFQRFMTGWSPGHYKLSDYSWAMSERAIEELSAELLGAARVACLAASRLTRAQRSAELELGAQAQLYEALEPSSARYDLELPTVMGAHVQAVFTKHARWSVELLGGAQHLIEGLSEGTSSVSLTASDGQVILGAAFDPTQSRLFEVVSGQVVSASHEPRPRDP